MRPLRNPYLATVKRLKPYDFHYGGFGPSLSTLLRDGAPHAIGPLAAAFHGKPFAAREHFVRKYSWAIPDEHAVRAIAKLSPIVEVGAGTGYWAWLLRQAGADVVATDLVLAKQVSRRRWTDIEPATGEMAAAAYPHRTLMLCWPTYQATWSYEALVAYQGRRVVYVGEGDGGCTGCEKFHGELEQGWRQIGSIPLPQWEGIHDYVRVFKRRRVR